jgi:hypothetical protein
MFNKISWSEVILVAGLLGVVGIAVYQSRIKEPAYTPQPVVVEDRGREIVDRMNSQTKENLCELEKSVIIEDL